MTDEKKLRTDSVQHAREAVSGVEKEILAKEAVLGEKSRELMDTLDKIKDLFKELDPTNEQVFAERYHAIFTELRALSARLRELSGEKDEPETELPTEPQQKENKEPKLNPELKKQINECERAWNKFVDRINEVLEDGIVFSGKTKKLLELMNSKSENLKTQEDVDRLYAQMKQINLEIDEFLKQEQEKAAKTEAKKTQEAMDKEVANEKAQKEAAAKQEAEEAAKKAAEQKAADAEQERRQKERIEAIQQEVKAIFVLIDKLPEGAHDYLKADKQFNDWYDALNAPEPDWNYIGKRNSQIRKKVEANAKYWEKKIDKAKPEDVEAAKKRSAEYDRLCADLKADWNAFLSVLEDEKFIGSLRGQEFAQARRAAFNRYFKHTPADLAIFNLLEDFRNKRTDEFDAAEADKQLATVRQETESRQRELREFIKVIAELKRLYANRVISKKDLGQLVRAGFHINDATGLIMEKQQPQSAPDTETAPPAPEPEPVVEQPLAPEPAPVAAPEETTPPPVELEQPPVAATPAGEQPLPENAPESPDAPEEKKSWWERTKEKAHRVQEAIFNRQVGKAAAETAWNSLTTILGVKVISDIFGYAAGKVSREKIGWGNIHKYAVDKAKTKEERAAIEDAFNSFSQSFKEYYDQFHSQLHDQNHAGAGADKTPVKEKVMVLREKIENAAHLKEGERQDLLRRLGRTFRDCEVRREHTATEKSQQVKELLGAYLEEKMSGAQLAAYEMTQAANTALTAANLPFLRGSVYALGAIVERSMKANVEFERARVKKGATRESRASAVLKDVFVNAAVETGFGLAGRGSKYGASGKQRAVDFIKSLGVVMRGLGIYGVALSDLKVEDAAETFVGRLETDGVGATVQENFLNNASRLWEVYTHPADSIRHWFGRKEPAVAPEAVETAPVAGEEQLGPDEVVLDKEALALATLRPGEGITYPIARQLEADSEKLLEVAKQVGLNPDKFTDAHKLAVRATAKLAEEYDFAHKGVVMKEGVGFLLAKDEKGEWAIVSFGEPELYDIKPGDGAGVTATTEGASEAPVAPAPETLLAADAAETSSVADLSTAEKIKVQTAEMLKGIPSEKAAILAAQKDKISVEGSAAKMNKSIGVAADKEGKTKTLVFDDARGKHIKYQDRAGSISDRVYYNKDGHLQEARIAGVTLSGKEVDALKFVKTDYEQVDSNDPNLRAFHATGNSVEYIAGGQHIKALYDKEEPYALEQVMVNGKIMSDSQYHKFMEALSQKQLPEAK